MGTTSDKLTYLNTTKTKLRDAIAITGQNVSSSTFREYEIGIKKGIINTLNNPTTVANNFQTSLGANETLTQTGGVYTWAHQ